MQKLLFQSGLSGLQKTFRPIQVYLYLDTIQDTDIVFVLQKVSKSIMQRSIKSSIRFWQAVKTEKG